MVLVFSDFLSVLKRISIRLKSFSIFLIIVCILSIIYCLVRLQSLNQHRVDQFKLWHLSPSLPWEETPINLESAIWPEDDPFSDRILAQLSIKEAADASKSQKKIFVFKGDFDIPYGKKVFIDKGCNVQSCIITSDDFANADAVLFKHRVTKSRNGVSPNQIWILFTLESPFHAGVVDPDKTVNWTATYRRDSDIVAPYAKWVYYDRNNPNLKTQTMKNYAEGRTRKVAMMVSNCNLQNNDRLKFARTLNKYIPVHIYGRCGNHTCKRNKGKECLEMLRANYKFYLAFENSNCRDYITEKFFVNALGNDLIPVVMGASPEEYMAVAPDNSYIHVDNFPSVEDLAEYLKLLDADDDMYNSYFQWKGTGEFIDTKFFCRLCALVNTPRPPKSYDSFQKWWNDRGICPSKKEVGLL